VTRSAGLPTTEVTGRTEPPQEGDDPFRGVFAMLREVGGILRRGDGPTRGQGSSDRTDGQRDLGALWHALGGLGIGALAGLFGWIAAAGVVVALAVGGWAREAIQHDPALTGHQWLEALAWPIGGALGAALSLGAQALL